MVQALPRGQVSGGEPGPGSHAQLHGGAAERAREIRGGGGAAVREPDHARPHRAGLRGRGRRGRSAQFHRVAHAQPRLLPHGRRAPAGRRRPRSLPRALARQDDVGPQSGAPAAARRRPFRRRGRQGPRASRRPPEPRPRSPDARQRRRRCPRPPHQGLDGSQRASGEGAGSPAAPLERGGAALRRPGRQAARSYRLRRFVPLSRMGPAARKWGGGQYVAFLLRKGRPVRRAVLGEAAPIERDWLSGGTTSAKAFGATPPTD